MERFTLYEQLRLIERSESEVCGAWKGAHLLLFFLAFVFGSFCTFCFHMLMYLFDEKCVLFPKLLSLTSLRHNVIYEFIPEEKERADMLPVDFLSTQWVEKSACYLPTYVPLVSSIFGLVWTTMFLMCSTGSRTLTGFQRPWRIIPPVLVFSLAMSGLCIYSSAVTHNGLRELCFKLGEITGSSTCSYTVNVATLAYERKIRGVYQATRLTITAAWLHTGCWLASAILALARILLAVDFRLVKIRVELVGSMDQMLERHEEQVRTVSPYQWDEEDDEHETNSLTSVSSTHIFFHNEKYDDATNKDDIKEDKENYFLLQSQQARHISKMALVPDEYFKLIRRKALESVRRDHKFIVNMLYNLLESLRCYSDVDLSSESLISLEDRPAMLVRHYGQQTITSRTYGQDFVSGPKTKEMQNELLEIPVELHDEEPFPSTSEGKDRISIESTMNTTVELKNVLEEKVDVPDYASPTLSSSELSTGTVSPYEKKSNLKPEEKGEKAKLKQKVKIAEQVTLNIDRDASSTSDKDNATQTKRKEKEKQD